MKRLDFMVRIEKEPRSAMCAERASKIARRSSSYSAHQASDLQIGMRTAAVLLGRPKPD